MRSEVGIELERGIGAAGKRVCRDIQRERVGTRTEKASGGSGVFKAIRMHGDSAHDGVAGLVVRGARGEFLLSIDDRRSDGEAEDGKGGVR